jgi:hypothetical protein
MMMAVMAMLKLMWCRGRYPAVGAWCAAKQRGAMPISAPSQRSMRASASHQMVMFMGFGQ